MPIRPTLLTVAALSLIAPWECAATTLDIRDGPARFRLRDHRTDGDIFSVDENTLYQESWYLISGGAVVELRDGSHSGSGASESLTYSTGLIGGVESITINYTIDYDSGTQAALLDISATILAEDGQAANASLINYFDIDLDGHNDDTLSFDSSTVTMTGTDPDTSTVVLRAADNPDAWEIDTYSDLRASILGGNLLSSSGSPVANNDITGAFQWNINLNAGESTTFTSHGAIGPGITAIPEPQTAMTTLALIISSILLSRRRPPCRMGTGRSSTVRPARG